MDFTSWITAALSPNFDAAEKLFTATIAANINITNISINSSTLTLHSDGQIDQVQEINHQVSYNQGDKLICIAAK